jgi:hypothetical protein
VVECDLAKVEVAGSNPVSRSRFHPRANRRKYNQVSFAAHRLCAAGSTMRWKVGLWAVIAVVVLAGLGCGSHLSSVNLTPGVADAKNFPNGQVQFIATGTYTGSSKVVPLTNLTWCVGTTNGGCKGNVMSVASVSSSGVAQCLPGATGTATILAGSGGHATNPDGGFNMAVFGSAQITCP